MKYQPLFTGQKFNRLTIISLYCKKLYVNPKTNHKIYREFYLCKCECGKNTVVYKDNIKNGHTKSCGCLNTETKSFVHRKHGQEGTRLYKIWQGMKKRCYLLSCDKYHLYGGRGIIMCDEWKNNFVPFFNWAMSNGYKENLTIDRIDVNGNYEPSNCRWATHKEQMRNTRKNHLIEFNGETKCVTEWAETLGISKKTLYGRIKKGWPIERILTK